MSRYDIFISYSHDDDADFVGSLVDELQKQGWSVWWDSWLFPGDHFPEEIRAALSDSKCAVVIWSVASVRSDWVEREAKLARDRGILIPVRIDGVNYEQIPAGLGSFLAADLSYWRGDARDPQFQKLLRAIREQLATLSGLRLGRLPRRRLTWFQLGAIAFVFAVAGLSLHRSWSERGVMESAAAADRSNRNEAPSVSFEIPLPDTRIVKQPLSDPSGQPLPRKFAELWFEELSLLGTLMEGSSGELAAVFQSRTDQGFHVGLANSEFRDGRIIRIEPHQVRLQQHTVRGQGVWPRSVLRPEAEVLDAAGLARLEVEAVWVRAILAGPADRFAILEFAYDDVTGNHVGFSFASRGASLKDGVIEAIEKDHVVFRR